jgi:inner membrane protein
LKKKLVEKKTNGNSLSHLGVGLLIALTLGFKGKSEMFWVFGYPTDLDFIPYIVFALVSSSVAMRYKPAFLPFRSQGIHALNPLHLAVTLLIGLKQKTAYSQLPLCSIFSHVYLDYATS